MIIVRYASEIMFPEELQSMYNYLKEKFDTDVLFLPQDFDILFNCTTSDLYHFRDEIDNLIRKKEIINEM